MITKGEFGVAPRDRAILSGARVGDLLFACINRKPRVVVGVFGVSSTIYERHGDVDEYPYPYRVKVHALKLTDKNQRVTPFAERGQVLIEPAFTLHSILRLGDYGKTMLKRLEHTERVRRGTSVPVA
jgi:hypothetical protein